MRSSRPYRVYLTLSGVSTLLNAMAFVVLTVYYVQNIGMNPFQLVLVGTVLEVSMFLFEVPTGIVADLYSRCASVIVGTFITGVALILAVAIPHFLIAALSQALLPSKKVKGESDSCSRKHA